MLSPHNTKRHILDMDESTVQYITPISCSAAEKNDTEQVRQQDAYTTKRGDGSYNYVQHTASFSRATSPPLIVCLYLAYSKLLYLTVASNAGCA